MTHRHIPRSVALASLVGLLALQLQGCPSQKLESIVLRQVVSRVERDQNIRTTCDEIMRQTNDLRTDPTALFSGLRDANASLVPEVTRAATSAVQRQAQGLMETITALGLPACGASDLIQVASGGDAAVCADSLQRIVGGLRTPGETATPDDVEKLAALRSLLRSNGIDADTLAQSGAEPRAVAAALLRSAVALDFSGPMMTVIIGSLDHLDGWLDGMINSFPLGAGIIGNALRPALDRLTAHAVSAGIERAVLRPATASGAQVTGGQATLPVYFARHACDAWVAGSLRTDLSQEFVERVILSVGDQALAQQQAAEVCQEFIWPTSMRCRTSASRVESSQIDLAAQFEAVRVCAPDDQQCANEVRRDMRQGEGTPPTFGEAFDPDARAGGADPIAATTQQALLLCGADCTGEKIGLAGGVLIREQRVGTAGVLDAADRVWLESELQRTREELAALGNEVAQAREQWQRDADALRAGQADLEQTVGELSGAINNVRVMVGRMDNTCSETMTQVAANRQRFVQSLDLRPNPATLEATRQAGGLAAQILESASTCVACPDGDVCICSDDQAIFLASVSAARLGELDAELQLNLPDSIPMESCEFELNTSANARLAPFQSLLYRSLDAGRMVMLTDVRGYADLSDVGEDCVESIEQALLSYPECDGAASASDREGQNRQLACLRAANTRAFLMNTSGRDATDVPIEGNVTDDCDRDASCKQASRRVEISIALTQGDRSLPLTMNWDDCMR
jgi:hypothetical protein